MIGETFGGLTVISQAGSIQHGRNKVKVWLCQCSCRYETILEVDQNSLKKGQVQACKICRRGPCAICGSPILNESYPVKRNTCSDECREEQVKQRHRRRYAKDVSNNPAHNSERWEERKEKDPELSQKRYRNKRLRMLRLPGDTQKLQIKKETRASNKWRSEWRKRMKVKNPEAYRQFLQSCRESQNRHLGQKRLRELFASAAKLSELREDDNG